MAAIPLLEPSRVQQDKVRSSRPSLHQTLINSPDLAAKVFPPKAGSRPLQTGENGPQSENPANGDILHLARLVWVGAAFEQWVDVL